MRHESGRRDRDTVESGPTPRGWWGNGRNITITEVLPREWGVCTHQTFQHGAPTPGKQAPRTSGIENQWGLCSEEQENYRKQDFSLTGHIQPSVDVNLKGLLVRPACWSWIQAGRRQLWLPLGMEMLALWRTCSVMITPALAATIWNSHSLLVPGVWPHLAVGQQQPCAHLGQTSNHVVGLPRLSVGTTHWTRHSLKTKWARGQPHLPVHLQ